MKRVSHDLLPPPRYFTRVFVDLNSTTSGKTSKLDLKNVEVSLFGSMQSGKARKTLRALMQLRLQNIACESCAYFTTARTRYLHKRNDCSTC